MQSDPGESRKLYCGAKVPSCKIWRNHFVFKASSRRIKFNNVRVSMTGHLSRGSNPALTQKSCVGFLRPSETTQINWRRLIYSWPKFGLEIRQRGRAEDRPHLTRHRSFFNVDHRHPHTCQSIPLPATLITLQPAATMAKCSWPWKKGGRNNHEAGSSLGHHRHRSPPPPRMWNHLYVTVDLAHTPLGGEKDNAMA
jgi:hypothetical protein